MIIIGVDYHPSVQQIAYCRLRRTGETCERRLNHSDGEAEHFYRALEPKTGQRAGRDRGLPDMPRWFERFTGGV